MAWIQSASGSAESASFLHSGNLTYHEAGEQSIPMRQLANWWFSGGTDVEDCLQACAVSNSANTSESFLLTKSSPWIYSLRS